MTRKHGQKATAEQFGRLLETIKNDSSRGVLLFFSILIYGTSHPPFTCSVTVCLRHALLFYFILASMHLGSGYVFVIPAFCILLARTVDNLQIFSPHTSKFVYLGLVFPALVLLFDFSIPVLDLLVPIMGRAGESSPAGIQEKRRVGEGERREKRRREINKLTNPSYVILL
jgi:hypothetical protein